jgi:hypothetical protein
MSKLYRIFYLIIFTAALNLQFFTNAQAQAFEAVVRIDQDGKRAEVKGKSFGEESKRTLSFLLSVAGTGGLGRRISNVKVSAPDGSAIAFKKLIDGEFLAESDIKSWEYYVDLAPPKSDGAAAHISWVSDGRGVLMLDDLLPQMEKGRACSGKVSLELPSGWGVLASEKRIGGNKFEVADAERAVFFIGRDWRSVPVREFPVEIAISGGWLFSDEDAAQMSAEIYGVYRKIFGRDPAGRIQIALTKFPNAVTPGQWQAETRGSTVTVVSSDMAFKTQSLQRLHEQLRHELFHLWVPNGLNLTGNYDWFYEGFALYQSLKTAVMLNRIRFDDFLDTLSRANSIDSRQTRRMSMIEASANRFSGSDTQVYARGMLVAFLTDLAMLESSKGERSVENIFRALYGKYGAAGDRQDANTAVLGVMQANTEVRPIIEKYVRGAGKIEWNTDLAAAGIDSLDENGHTTLKVRSKLNGRQKALLDKLGYNNWRKLSRNSK